MAPRASIQPPAMTALMAPVAALPILHDLAIVLTVAAVTTVLCHLLRQPVVLGYLIAGVIVGPHTPPATLVTDESWVDRIVIGSVIAILLLAGGIIAAREYTRRRPGGRRPRGVLRRFARDVLDGLSEPLGVMRTQKLLLLSVAAWLTWVST